MSKVLFLICAMSLAATTQAECLVYKGSFKTGKVYTQTNGDTNTAKSSYRGAYLIVEYTPASDSMDNAYLVKFWTRGTARFYTVENFDASFDIEFVNDRKRVVITDIANDQDEKSFIVMISGRFVFRREISQAFPLPPGMTGSRVYEVVNDLGERELTSQYIRLKMAQKWTADNFTSNSTDTLASVTDQLKAKGYKLVE